MTEPENDAHDFWISVVTDSDGSPVSIAALANQRDAQAVLGARDALTPHNLRRFLNRFVDKPRTKQRIRRVGQRYWVDRVS